MRGGRRWLLSSFGMEGDAQDYLAHARELEERGEQRLAATAYDRAYGLAPDDQTISAERASLLDRLAVVEHGLTFRYIPAGSFLMGSGSGDPDERPVHIVELGDYWLSDTPISWALFCDLMGLEPAPGWWSGDWRFVDGYEIRLQYCEDGTLRAHDWHWHTPTKKTGTLIGGWHHQPERTNPDQPWTYNLKPMIAVGWPLAEELATRLSTEHTTYRLPTEAEWEKAARGGLIDSRYPWGNEPPTPDRCDYDRFEQLSIQHMRHFPPNGYGLYSMSGGVWEWTRDWYDNTYYVSSPPVNPTGPGTGTDKVIRGGSWADCAEVLRVTFRASYPAATSFNERYSINRTPNIGFRLCRIEHRMS